MSRQTLRRGHRKICVGDFRDRIIISDREITEPAFGQTTFGESFTANIFNPWAKVRTINGRTLFNGVDADVALTHEITIRYDSRVTAESWVLFADGTRLDVKDAQDPEERNEYLILLCTARGTQEASKA